jgi:hypothetical protein
MTLEDQILVKFRCKVRGCGKVLGWLDEAGAETDELWWADMMVVPRCPRHGGANGSVAKWVEKRRRAGLPHDRYATGQWIYRADLRPAVRRARLTGEPQDHFV